MIPFGPRIDSQLFNSTLTVLRPHCSPIFISLAKLSAHFHIDHFLKGRILLYILKAIKINIIQGHPRRDSLGLQADQKGKFLLKGMSTGFKHINKAVVAFF